ncbi:MAG: hypothetical protein WC852_06225 [Candidatus Nanoarchaeia archaeon]|jgi:hypothetical protein
MNINSKVIRLRPHHATGLFLDDVHKTEEEIRQYLEDHRYDSDMIDNLLDINRRILQQGALIKLVPSLDDICEKCNQKVSKIKSTWKINKLCFEKDDAYDIDEVNEFFGMKFGRIYNPMDLLFKRKTYYETMLRPLRAEHGFLREGYEQKLATYTRLYENLKQQGVN